MTRSEKHKNWILRAVAVLLCLTVASICATSGLYARYTAGATFSDGARVALWGSTETITLPQNYTESLVPGSSFTYAITVTNQRDNQTSEVSQNYYIEVKTAGNLPLEFTLTRNGAELTATNGKWQDANMSFAAGRASEHSYTLTVKWPDEKNKADLYAGIPDYVQINVCAQQAD